MQANRKLDLKLEFWAWLVNVAAAVPILIANTVDNKAAQILVRMENQYVTVAERSSEAHGNSLSHCELHSVPAELCPRNVRVGLEGPPALSSSGHTVAFLILSCVSEGL